jgi:hypothetical protein
MKFPALCSSARTPFAHVGVPFKRAWVLLMLAAWVLLSACQSEVDRCVIAGVAAELESQQDQRIRLTQWESQSQENTQAWDRFLAARPIECMDRESFYTSPVGAPHRKELAFLRGGGDLRPGLSAYEKHCQLSSFKPPFPDLAKDPPITDTSSSEQIEFKVRVICMQATKK